MHLDASKKMVFFDSPGLNNQCSMANFNTINALKQMDYVFITVCDTFKRAYDAVMVMNKVNPSRLVLVRTKCDEFPN